MSRASTIGANDDYFNIWFPRRWRRSNSTDKAHGSGVSPGVSPGVSLRKMPSRGEAAGVAAAAPAVGVPFEVDMKSPSPTKETRVKLEASKIGEFRD